MSLIQPRQPGTPCYVCKTPVSRAHESYPQMCASCGEFNLQKRSQRADLRERVALVTGARVKIGYQVALKLLRDGAFVIATSRFPHDAASRFAREADFEQWCERLRIYGLDLRHLPSVEGFTDHLRARFERLDMIVNNAAQTVRRPPAYYAHLMELEGRSFAQLPTELQGLLDGEYTQSQRALPSRVSLLSSIEGEPGSLVAPNGAHSRPHLSATLSQLKLLLSDEVEAPTHFPAGDYDSDGQQIDLRPHNSWTMRLDDVSTPELVEVHLVNAIAPFLLIARLKPLMEGRIAGGRHIVNVTSMEGAFSGFGKSIYHPHTNMAKAALNMMTRTSARDYRKAGIYMNGVDTGWITDENPHPIAQTMKENGFKPPLDAIDGAARICDPIYTAVTTGQCHYGKLFKDYTPREW